MVKKAPFREQDWLVGGSVGLACMVAIIFGLLEGLERKAYDLGLRSIDRTPSEKVAIIAIDDASIERIGRWPWPREIQAQALQFLAKGGAKVVANTILYSEPQLDRGSTALRDLARQYDSSSLPELRKEAVTLKDLIDQVVASQSARLTPKPRTPEEREYLAVNRLASFLSSATYLNRAPSDAEHLRELFGQTEGRPDSDHYLGQTIRNAGNVLLGAFFELGPLEGLPDHPSPEYLRRYAIKNVSNELEAQNRGFFPLSSTHFLASLPEIASGAVGIGHITVLTDSDGAVRSMPVVLNYYGEYYPSLSLLAVQKYLNLRTEDVHIRMGEGVDVGGLSIPTDVHLLVYPHFYPSSEGKNAFSIDSFDDLRSGRIPPTKYAGKIVLLGVTAKGVADTYPTPISPTTSPVQILASEISSILQGHTYTAPDWGSWVTWLVWLLTTLYLIFGLPHLKAKMAVTVTGVLVIGMVLAHFILMSSAGLWISLMTPAVFLVLGHLFATTKRYLTSERGKAASDSAAAESNRMLGLAFQGQGQLDMAFEKFRRSPMDEGLMELLYNLALDFERKRQYAKAGSVFTYMADFNPKFRDLSERMARARSLEQTVVMGGSTGPGGTIVLGGPGTQKPMLGRYQVEKELGRGAMGAVYLGRDPKINRVVAIKTMALSQEFEQSELTEVKQRFFREAETAGRLSHPHIVTIYDAGEEQDLAYIAMELLKGKDLSQHIAKDRLLPVATVLDLVRKIAEALHYAYNQNVVHRDIKPANIMYEPESGILKVTDFGIARITDSSKTKTGVVMGTPSYMSPEQLSGQKVDGRSDLFSLGVMLYQMLTGVLPFTGDSMATLMYQIANVAHRDVRAIRPDLPPCLSQILNRALAKDVNSRYQTGVEMVMEIATCAGKV